MRLYGYIRISQTIKQRLHSIDSISSHFYSIQKQIKICTELFYSFRRCFIDFRENKSIIITFIDCRTLPLTRAEKVPDCYRFVKRKVSVLPAKLLLQESLFHKQTALATFLLTILSQSRIGLLCGLREGWLLTL